MTKREWVNQMAEDREVEVLVMDEFDEAIVGLGYRLCDQFVIYDPEKIIEILMRSGSSEEEAREHFEYNVAGGWAGEGTPVFIEYPPACE
jgi:hypothetical protein